MKKVYNPSEDKLEIQYKGVQYSIGAKDFELLPEEVAQYWSTQIHTFLEVSNTSTGKPMLKEVEIPEEVIVSREDVVAELSEEEVSNIEEIAEKSDLVANIKKAVKGKK